MLIGYLITGVPFYGLKEYYKNEKERKNHIEKYDAGNNGGMRQ
jgi:CHASE3 domain sensor protein